MPGIDIWDAAADADVAVLLRLLGADTFNAAIYAADRIVVHRMTMASTQC